VSLVAKNDQRGAGSALNFCSNVGGIVMRRHWQVLFSMALCLFVGVSPTFATKYLYVNNNAPANTISGFRVNSDGSLTLLPGFPLADGGQGGESPVEGVTAKIRVSGSYLYLANLTSGDISAFQIRADGSLAPVAGQPFSTGSALYALTLAMHPSGKFLVCGNSTPGGSSPNDLSVFSVNSDGTLSPVPGSPFVASSPPYSTAFTPDGKFLFAGGNLGTTISVYRFNPITGALSEVSGSPFDSGGSDPLGYSVSSDGQRLFSALFSTHQIGVYDIDPSTGALAAIFGSPFAAGFPKDARPIDSVLDPHGKRLFVVGRLGPENVYVYGIAASGEPTPVAGTPFQSGGTTAEVVVIDNKGGLLFVANAESHNVSVFEINPQTGALTAVAGSPFAAGDTTGYLGGMVLYEEPAPVPANTGGGLTVFALLLTASIFVVLSRNSRRAWS
jgi:6-phosphogluconolactonase